MTTVEYYINQNLNIHMCNDFYEDRVKEKYHASILNVDMKRKKKELIVIIFK